MKKSPNPPEDNINFLPGILFMTTVAVIVGISVFVLNRVNNSRNQQVVDEYTQETLDYISQNQAGLKNVFTQSFEQSKACLQYDYSDSNRRTCLDDNSSFINSQITDNLKDFSSIMFIRLNRNEVEILRLSGNSESQREQYYGQHQSKVIELLQDKRDSLPWDDYFYQLRGQEVIIPVNIDNNLYGAIVRGVIEQQT